MTNKKFKKAAMALALTACVAVTPLAANLAVDGGNIPPCERYKIVFRKQKIGFKYFLL